ncbi:MAG TPA: hypothetical protein VK876_09495 [Rubrivivax sp.]|nr:hypothetical protein [Rubrivivax sp.]
MLLAAPELQASLTRPGSHLAWVERVLTDAAAPVAAHVFTALFAEEALAAEAALQAATAP